MWPELQNLKGEREKVKRRISHFDPPVAGSLNELPARWFKLLCLCEGGETFRLYMPSSARQETIKRIKRLVFQSCIISELWGLFHHLALKGKSCNTVLDWIWGIIKTNKSKQRRGLDILAQIMGHSPQIFWSYIPSGSF